MLTRELAIAEYDFARGRILPDRLMRIRHGRYTAYADRCVEVYREGAGRTRKELHRDLHSVFVGEEDCPTRRIDAFCKLLDDESEYARDRRGQAAALRRQVFQMAAESHPLVARADRLFDKEEEHVKAEVAEKLGRSWEEIETQLFADVMEFHRLEKFDPSNMMTSGAALLARYNVAQVQAALFGAVSLTVWAREDLKTILRYAKLARLMHTIIREDTGVREGSGNREVANTSPSYRMRFDGPASVLRQTRRYGAAMARFLPALIACRNWRMHAVVQTRRGGWMLSLDLSSADGLTGRLPAPGDFDSTLERAFAERWGDQRRDGWRLERETEILHRGQKVFIPDFVFRHEDGRTVLLEIVGFWTPEYLQTKLETLRYFRDHAILLAVTEENSVDFPEFASSAIRFKTRLKVKDVLKRLQAY